MLTEIQKSYIKQLKDIACQHSELLIVSIFLYFQWNIEKTTDFIINAGEYLSDDLIPEYRRQAAEKLLKQEEEAQKLAQKKNIEIANSPNNFLNNQKKQQVENNLPSINLEIKNAENKQIRMKKITQIKENLQLIENMEWETQSIIKDRELIIQLSQKQNEKDKLELRCHQSLAGIEQCESSGSFNCIYQLLFWNPEIVDTIFNLAVQNKEDQNTNFLNQLQYLFASLILTNDRFVKNSELYVAASKLNKLQINNNGQVNFAYQFEIQLNILKKFFQDVKQDYVSFIVNQFQTFQTHPFLKLQQEDRLFQLSLLEQMDNLQQIVQQQNQKSYWAFEIIRRSEVDNNYQDNLDYWFPLKFDLEILMLKDRADQILKILEEKTKEDIIKEIKKNQKIINALQIIKSTLSEQDFMQQETIDTLQREYEVLEKLMYQFIPFNMDQLEINNQNNQHTYCLQATVIEQKGDNYHLFYLYIKNFNQNKWFRIYNSEVESVSEDLVLKDTRKYGCFLVYVKQEQIQNIKEYQKILSEIANKILMNHDESILDYLLIQKLQMSNVRQFEKVLKLNQQNEIKLNEELNDEFDQ